MLSVKGRAVGVKLGRGILIMSPFLIDAMLLFSFK
jgi:hypothetical protein